ncbi:NUDIX domain-containing protein [Streptomyces sp. NPDC020196]|uniref:NUDIX domain-containing protein n=1 Tax=Streptomyces sp. NPDC020196 TaxID=3156656 RepID=UPI0033DEA6AD
MAGHCEQENAIACLIREAQEEAGLHIERQDVELVHVVHHIGKPRNPPRMGLFFRDRTWRGEPKLREPDKCLQWDFFDRVVRRVSGTATHRPLPLEPQPVDIRQHVGPQRWGVTGCMTRIRLTALSAGQHRLRALPSLARPRRGNARGQPRMHVRGSPGSS